MAPTPNFKPIIAEAVRGWGRLSSNPKKPTMVRARPAPIPLLNLTTRVTSEETDPCLHLAASERLVIDDVAHHGTGANQQTAHRDRHHRIDRYELYGRVADGCITMIATVQIDVATVPTAQARSRRTGGPGLSTAGSRRGWRTAKEQDDRIPARDPEIFVHIQISQSRLHSRGGPRQDEGPQEVLKRLVGHDDRESLQRIFHRPIGRHTAMGREYHCHGDAEREQDERHPTHRHSENAGRNEEHRTRWHME